MNKRIASVLVIVALLVAPAAHLITESTVQAPHICDWWPMLPGCS